MAKITKTFLPKANKKKSVLFFFLLTGLTIVGRGKKKASQGLELHSLSLRFSNTHVPYKELQKLFAFLST